MARTLVIPWERRSSTLGRRLAARAPSSDNCTAQADTAVTLWVSQSDSATMVRFELINNPKNGHYPNSDPRGQGEIHGKAAPQAGRAGHALI
jgi:hypothetical protein